MIRQYAKVGRVFSMITKPENFENTLDEQCFNTVSDDTDTSEINY